MSKTSKNPRLPGRIRTKSSLAGYKFRGRPAGKSLSEKKPLYQQQSGLDGNEYSLDELELK